MSNILTREAVVELRNGTLVAMAALKQMSGGVPKEADEMLSLMDTALHWMDQTVAGKDKVLRCAFCGHAYAEGTPTHKAQSLADHARVCPDHPIGQENRRLRLACSHAIDRMKSEGVAWGEIDTLRDALDPQARPSEVA